MLLLTYIEKENNSSIIIKKYIKKMEISVSEIKPGITRISLSGRFDAEGVTHIRVQFLAAAEAKARLVIVEMSGVSFMASTGIRLLLLGAKSLKATGGKLVVAGPKDNVAYPMTISGVDTVVPIYSSVEKAIASLG